MQKTNSAIEIIELVLVTCSDCGRRVEIRAPKSASGKSTAAIELVRLERKFGWALTKYGDKTEALCGDCVAALEE